MGKKKKTKQLILLSIFCLTTIQAFAQDTIVTMTASRLVNFYVEWTGTGSITANGVELKNDFDIENRITTTVDSLVVLTVMGDAQLTGLNCSSNLLTALDIIKCPELRELSCSVNFLTVLDISKCSKLKILNCSSNYLSTLDVTKCSELRKLFCSSNALTVLDISKCSKLKTLACNENYLSALNVTKCTELKGLLFGFNFLTSIDVTKCTELTDLSCYNNFLTTLDVTNCPELEYLIAHNQTPVLPIARVKRAKLRIKNPVTFAGVKAGIDNISPSGAYTNGIITWMVSGDDGEASFRITTELPNGIYSKPFSGTAIQPWTTKTKHLWKNVTFLHLIHRT